MYHKIGEVFTKRPPMFHLDIDSIFPTIYSCDQNLKPRDYFITSGDAIQKTIYMRSDICKLRDRALNDENFIGYSTDAKLQLVEQCDIALLAINSLLENLYEARGENVFLETEWDDHYLLCIPKNPRGN